ncbi:MAG: CehA/McbA family metallohydrolase [Vicinamibacterales bacterium]
MAAVVMFAAVSLPPPRLTLAPPGDATVAGILHVHTNRSDGLSGPDEVAAAAARAGLRFLVFTDHGDATRVPDPPTYRSGVLCLDGVEISTTGGHYIAIDMPAAPYPLGGEPRDVVEDVRRLRGFGIVAHPDSPKPQLRWRDWGLPFDGVELLNPDTSWRVLAAQPGWSAARRLFAAFLDYPFRAPEVMSSLIQPTAVLDRWAAVAERRRIVAIAGADAHAKLAPRNADPGDSRFALPLPGYEASFRVLSVHVRPDRPLGGDAAADAAILMRALRNGHLYTAVDGVASPPSFEFTATNDHGTVHEGDELGAGGPVRLRVQSNAPPGFTTIVHEGTATIATAGDTQDLTVHASERPAAYWAEIRSTGREPALTWIRSNPVYVRSPDEPVRAPARPAPATSRPMFDGRSAEGWHVESDPTSLAAVDVGSATTGAELRFRFGLAGGTPIAQVAALVIDTPSGLASSDRLAVTIRAERPMRISVQLRAAAIGRPGEDRWQRSIYIDSAAQDRTIAWSEMTPVGATERGPALAEVRSILFAVDLTNTKAGASGRVWIKSAQLQR